MYGGGVYGATFSVDQKFIVVPNQFGVDVVDVNEKKSHSFYIVDFPQLKNQNFSGDGKN